MEKLTAELIGVILGGVRSRDLKKAAGETILDGSTPSPPITATPLRPSSKFASSAAHHVAVQGSSSLVRTQSRLRDPRRGRSHQKVLQMRILPN